MATYDHNMILEGLMQWKSAQAKCCPATRTLTPICKLDPYCRVIKIIFCPQMNTKNFQMNKPESSSISAMSSNPKTLRASYFGPLPTSNLSEKCISGCQPMNTTVPFQIQIFKLFLELKSKHIQSQRGNNGFLLLSCNKQDIF